MESVSNFKLLNLSFCSFPHIEEERSTQHRESLLLPGGGPSCDIKGKFSQGFVAITVERTENLGLRALLKIEKMEK